MSLGDKKYWNEYWTDNKEKNSFFNTLVSLARKYYFAKAFAVFINNNFPVKDKVVYEIGSGSGLTLSYLKKFGAKQCVGVDYSEEAIKMAKENGSDCEFIQGDAFDLSNIKDKSCDIVYSLGFFEHYSREEQKQLLAEQRRIARECVFIEVPCNILHVRLLYSFNTKMGRTNTFSNEELFRDKTFREIGLKGETKMMPGTFFITIGHFEYQ